jgi:thiosulfate reductase cytochrome b subunit
MSVLLMIGIVLFIVGTLIFLVLAPRFSNDHCRYEGYKSIANDETIDQETRERCHGHAKHLRTKAIVYVSLYTIGLLLVGSGLAILLNMTLNYFLPL